MRARYTNPVIRQLRDRIIRGAPCDRQIAQADLAEKLLGELDPDRTYSCRYLCAQITDQPASGPPMRITGSQASRDLQLFVEDLSDAANLSATEAGEPVLTLEDLSRKLNVSTKTISRWREQGLVSRRFVVDGRKRVGFLQSSVERFVRRNKNLVERAAHFSQLTDRQREEIVAAARRSAESGGSPRRITGALARQTGRSVETIRYVLRQYDRAHPESPIFSTPSGPLAEATRREIYQHYRRGEQAGALAKRFGRSRTSIYRIIAQMRLERIAQFPLDYIPNEQFDKVHGAGQEREILAPTPPGDQQARKTRRPADLPTYLASLYETPLLTRQQEAHLFRKMNYLKHKASKLHSRLDPERPSAALMDRIEKLYEQSAVVKNEIIRANLRLVVSIAKRRVGPTEEFFDLVSDGNMSLIRAVEKFDFARGNKFSTYATWAIVKNFARSIPKEHRHRERFHTSQDDLFGAVEDSRTDPYAEDFAQAQRESQIAKILGHLDQREQQVIAHRFGLGRDQEPLTLKEVGSLMGVTKERVRQLEGRALDKLRQAARAEKIDIPGVA